MLNSVNPIVCPCSTCTGLVKRLASQQVPEEVAQKYVATALGYERATDGSIKHHGLKSFRMEQVLAPDFSLKQIAQELKSKLPEGGIMA